MAAKTYHRSSSAGINFIGSSFSGADVLPVAFLHDDNSGEPVIFADLQTMTITSAVSSSPVLRLGQQAPVKLSKTDRTTAGTMIFSHIDQSPLMELTRKSKRGGLGDVFRHQTDIPPFDVLLSAQSEVGLIENGKVLNTPLLKLILGIELLNGSETVSIDDMLLEHQYTYWAQTSTDWFIAASLAEMMAEVKNPTVKNLGFSDLQHSSPSSRLSIRSDLPPLLLS